MTFSITPGPAPAQTIPLVPASRSRAARSAEALESTGEGVNPPASFANELASVIEKYLAQSENGSRIEIRFTNETDGARRQLVVTVQGPAEEAAAPAVPATPAQPALSPSQFLMYSGTVQYAPKPAEEAAPEKPKNVYDAYWATQPPEVRVLRTIESEAERTRKAQELAGQGFAIDVPIMVWQWDPLMTMRAREAAGYTWVPSANGQPIELGPGIDFPGLRPYDANNPPTGSIKVSTEWAKGLEESSIWWRPGIFAEPEPPAGAGDAPVA